MRKALKLSLIIVALLLIAAIVFSFTSYELARGTPDWYRPHSLNPEQRARAAQRADDKLLTLIGRATDAQAAEVRRQHHTSDLSPHPIGSEEPVTVSFSADELNAFFYKWIQLNHWDRKIEAYLGNPQIVLHNGHIIIAGTIPWQGMFRGTVLSVHFLPKIDDQGRLQFSIDGISAGRLPLPQAVWDAKRNDLEALVSEKLPALRRSASISDSGSANAAAVAACMSQSLLNVLNDLPAAPILFLPLNSHLGYPMKLTTLSVDEGSITLGAVPLTPQQRAELLAQIRNKDTRG